VEQHRTSRIVFTLEEQARIRSAEDFLALLEEKLGCLNKAALDAARPRIDPSETFDMLGPILRRGYGDTPEAVEGIEAMNQKRPSSLFEQDVCLDAAKSAARTALSSNDTPERTAIGILTELSFNANNHSVDLHRDGEQITYHAITLNIPMFRLLKEVSMYVALIILTAQRPGYGKRHSFKVFEAFIEYCQILMDLGDDGLQFFPPPNYKVIDSPLLPEALGFSVLAATVGTTFALLHELGHRYLHHSDLGRATRLPPGVARYCHGIMDANGRGDRESEADSFAVRSLTTIGWNEHISPDLFPEKIPDEIWGYSSAIGVGALFAVFELLKPRPKLWHRVLGVAGATMRRRFQAIIKEIDGQEDVWNKATAAVKMASYVRSTNWYRRPPKFFYDEQPT
jgi:hypothetical protein